MNTRGCLLAMTLTGCIGYGINPFEEPVDPGSEVPSTPASWGVGNQVCNLAADPGNLISPDEDCGHTYTVDEPWDVEVEWTFGDGTELSHHAVHVPLVANLMGPRFVYLLGPCCQGGKPHGATFVYLLLCMWHHQLVAVTSPLPNNN